jgi:surfactin synthase thioesterase subunit
MDSNNWFYIPKRCEQPVSRLFCFHPAGANALFFKDWDTLLPENVELAAIQLPGRFPREHEKTILTMDELVACIQEAMRPLLDRPYVLFGHSMGALIIYEILKKLSQQTMLQPACFLVSASTAPQLLGTKTLYGNLKQLESFGKLFQADIGLLETINYTSQIVMDIPLIICGGNYDLLVNREDLLGWQELTRAKTSIHFYKGGHDYILDNMSNVIELLKIYLAPKGATSFANEVSTSENLLLNFSQRWQKNLGYTFGTRSIFHLAYTARVNKAGLNEPAFPQALMMLIALHNDDGSIGKPSSPTAVYNFLRAIAFVNTLIKWNAYCGERYQALIETSVDYIMKLLSEDLELAVTKLNSAYGNYYRFEFPFLPVAYCAQELELLFENSNEYLPEHCKVKIQDKLMLFKQKAALVYHFFAKADYEKAFEEINKIVFFISFLPDKAFFSVSAKNYADYVFHASMPHNLMYCARLYELTQDKRAYHYIQQRLGQSIRNLIPTMHLPEILFAVSYLFRTNIDVKKYFPWLIEEVQKYDFSEGVGLQTGDIKKDCDMSAEAYFINEMLGRPTTQMPITFFEQWWDEKIQRYGQIINTFVRNILTVGLKVLKAYLVSPDASFSTKSLIWQRIIAMLEQPWIEFHHCSPFYTWEIVVAVITPYLDLFPNYPTQAHQQAINLILACQQANGGFKSELLQEASIEESAMALLAFKTALRYSQHFTNNEQIKQAALKAQQFIVEHWQSKPAYRNYEINYIELWPADLPVSAVNLDEAIVLASIIEPI